MVQFNSFLTLTTQSKCRPHKIRKSFFIRLPLVQTPATNHRECPGFCLACYRLQNAVFHLNCGTLQHRSLVNYLELASCSILISVLHKTNPHFLICFIEIHTIYSDHGFSSPTSSHVPPHFPFCPTPCLLSLLFRK